MSADRVGRMGHDFGISAYARARAREGYPKLAAHPAQRPAAGQNDGPFAYEITQFRLDHILAGAATLQRSEMRPSREALSLLMITAQLARRMSDPRQKTMLCMTCDHEFVRGERPTEIVVARPWATLEDPPIVSPICAACAAADPVTKISRVKAMWARLSPGSRALAPGRA